MLVGSFMKQMLKILVLVLFLIPVLVDAKIGVGVAAGKIEVDRPLKPGGIYGLPVVPVLNTGDETNDYGFSVEYLEYQDEQKPPREWFRFDPEEYSLEPGQVEEIRTKLLLPVDARPGKYFVFLEAHPINKDDGSGETSVNIAAASKLYFEIAPSNIWQGMYYRTISLLNQYSPWSYVGVAVICVLVLTILFRRFFTFRISLGRRTDSSD